MDFYSLSDKHIEKELGARIKALRLRKNITQKELAEATTFSLNAIKSLESGRGKIATLIPVLRELGVLEHLDNFIPETSISPLQLAKRQGKERARASGERLQKTALRNKSKDKAEW